MRRNIDGSSKPQFKDKSGTYHVEGDLVLAPKDVQLNLYKLMRPLLEAVGQKPFVIVTPMRRYARSTCCESSLHITNFSNEDYNNIIERDLEEVRKNMRSFIFGDNINRAVVLGPGPLMAQMGVESCWADDPVHPLPVVYKELAKLVMSNLDRLKSKVSAADNSLNRKSGGGRDWRNRRGGQWGRGGRGGGWSARGGGGGGRASY